MSDAMVGGGAALKTPEPSTERNASLWADARRDLLRNPSFVISALFLMTISSMAVFPKLWTKADPYACALKVGDQYNNRLPMFSPGHWLGTSEVGCDYYAHLIYGTRPSLQVALLSTLGILLIGMPLGILAGFYGGLLDAIISRVVDMVLALPFLLAALVVLSMIRVTDPKQRIWTLTLVLVILGWTGVARIIRGSVISVKSLDFVQAAKALGANNSRLMFRHILPNAIAPVFVVASIALGGFVAVEATLSFLGVGLQAPAISWGIMISSHQPIFNEYPHLVLIPCALLVGTILSFVLIGDALRDALDPKLR